jgi:hypothetical protein
MLSAVGALKELRNHSAVAGEKRSSTSAPGPLPGSLCVGEAIGASVPPATDSRATEIPRAGPARPRGPAGGAGAQESAAGQIPASAHHRRPILRP